MPRTDVKPILLTGASGNLGRALTKGLAALGWTLVLTDIKPFPDPLPAGARFEKLDLEDGVALLRLAEGYPVPPRLAAVLVVSAACSVATAPILWLRFGAVPAVESPSTEPVVLVRLDSGGHLDTSFAAGGVARAGLMSTGGTVDVTDLVQQSDGKFLVAATQTFGSGESLGAIVRFTAAGIPRSDLSFVL